ncbi:transposase [Lentilactobacillus diolivorans DSM 14421]|uniref:Transposase n=1 Tax=Lentilactobacillus diolivorans DSM 14421 TaxID=1423739 RepID=A0A0R1SC05_9LACO|nr:transposase [Lentilactobacillus diolivorans DSM 14421]
MAQTSGDPVLSAKDFVKENLADHQNVTSLYNAFKDYLNQQTDLKVSEVPLATLNGAKGYFQPSTNEIVIGGDEPDNALKLKTLYHEYAHSQLHGLKSAFKDRPRAYQETQAEAVAYVAMQNIGVDTSNYSLGYVATWAKDKAVIHSALSEIQQVSNKVIELRSCLKSLK